MSVLAAVGLDPGPEVVLDERSEIGEGLGYESLLLAFTNRDQASVAHCLSLRFVLRFGDRPEVTLPFVHEPIAPDAGVRILPDPADVLLLLFLHVGCLRW